jgi:putative endonuclease
MPVVCILCCSDGTFYAGHTNGLAARLKPHNAGPDSSYTATGRPVDLMHHEVHRSLESAVARERQLERWRAAKKDPLSSGDLARLRQVGRRRPTPR